MWIPSRFSTGYGLPTEANPMLVRDPSATPAEAARSPSPPRSTASAFGYVMNHVVAGSADVRAASLVDAVRGLVARN